MEIKITTKHILGVLAILSWIIFAGLCVEAGALIFNTIYALNKPIVAGHYWNGIDLSELYSKNESHFITLTILMSIVATMKALLFYLIIVLFHNKKFSRAKPFNPDIIRMVWKFAYLCLGISMFSFWATRFAEWIRQQNISLPTTEQLLVDGARVWLFMSVVLFVIGQVFKKGTQLQTENDLTV